MIRIKNPIAPRLPSEYQEVEYIESTSTQYINTGYAPGINAEFEIQYMTLERQSYGPYVGGSAIFTIPFPRQTNNIFFGNNCGTQLSASHTYSSTTKYTVKGYPNGTAIINDTAYPCERGTKVPSGEFCLFTYGGDLANYSVYIGKVRIYYFKLWDNGELVRDMIPCYRISDNVAGLYDLANNVFYTNAGTGVFLRGNEVNKRDVNIKPMLGDKPLIRRYAGDKKVYDSREMMPDFTKLLMHFENNLTDNTGLNTPIIYGTEKYATGKIGNAFQFDGSSAIKIPYNSNIVFGKNDFTIAGWFYLPASQPSYARLFSHTYRYNSTYTYSGVSVGFDGTKRTLFFQVYTSYSNGSTRNWGSTQIPTNEWVHIAFVRSGSTFALYINGKREIQATSSESVYQHTSSSFKIGSATNESASNDNPAAILANGSMVDEFIIVNGSALWVEDFTPPDRAYV